MPPRPSMTCRQPFSTAGLQAAAVVCIAIASLTVAFSRPLAAEVVEVHSEKQFALAQAAFQAGEYDRAVVEFERFVHFFPHDARIDLARFSIARCHYENQRYHRALDGFLTLTDPTPPPPLAVRSWLMISRCHLGLQESEAAMAVLENLIRIAGEETTRDEARYRLGWILLGSGRFEAADRIFERISPDGRRRYRLAALSRELSAAPLPDKDPMLAGLLAVVPGAGHLYCGRPRDALVALIVNAAFLYAAVDSFDNGNDGLGVLLSGLGISFYSASIYSAVSSAHKANRTLRLRFIDRLHQELHVPPSAAWSPPGLVLTFEQRF